MTLQDRVAEVFADAREDVYRYLLTLDLAPPQAQDAAQEVFLRLYVALRKGDAIENTRAWLFRVAHNLGLNIRARERRLAPLAPGLEDAMPDNGSGPEKQILDKERLDKVNAAIDTLSAQQRQCLYLRAEGLRYREIADTLGLKVSTVGEFLSRAVARLRKATHE